MSASRPRARLAAARLAACCWLLAQLAAYGQSATPLAIPPALEAWQAWVVDDPAAQRRLRCPALPGVVEGGVEGARAHVCVWYDRLALSLDGETLAFRQRVRVYLDDWVALPGSASAWPRAVRREGADALAVVDRGRGPEVYLPAGEHRLSGVLTWRGPPLQIPRVTGLVSVSTEGQAVARLARVPGQLWLGERPDAPEAARERLDLRVFRLLEDGVPARLTTLLQLDVAGAARELTFQAPLPEGFVPTALETSDGLTAQLSAGQLRLRVVPGAAQTVTIVARSQSPARTLDLGERRDAWPASEVWSYQQDSTLRSSTARGANPVDPALEQVPRQWQRFPAYRLTRDAPTLEINERQRGRSPAEGNALSLQRALYLDFDGDGFTASDLVAGQMVRGWRLDMRAPYTLLAAPNVQQPALVTAGVDGARGIEIRNARPALRTLARLDGASAVPVTGWSETLEPVRTTLHLPPGYRLLAAFGVDAAEGAWLSRWQLLDSFLLLLTAVVAGRLFGWWPWSLVFGVMLLLNGSERHAPPMAIWLFPLALVAIGGRVEHPRIGQLLRALRLLALLVFAVLVMPYGAQQLRSALFPQLEAQDRAFQQVPDDTAAYTRAPDAAPAAADEEVVTIGSRSALENTLAQSSALDLKRVARALELPASTPVQAGPGVPSWTFHRHSLRWDGPVAPGARMSLWIAPRWLIALWRVLAVLTMGAVLLRLVRGLFPGAGSPPSGPAAGAPPGAAALWLLLTVGVTAGLLTSPPAVAQGTDLPDRALLGELRERLLEAPPCTPHCVEIAEADVRVDGQEVQMTLAVHSLDDTAVALPGTETGFVPAQVSVDGQAVREFFRDGAGTLWMAIGAGVFEVTLRGPLPGAATVQIPFPQHPRAARLTLNGWQSRSVARGQLLGDVLSLVRVLDLPAGADAPLGPSELTPFVRVLRRFVFDATWRLETQVTRIAPARESFEVSVPLLPFESPADDDLSIRDEAVVLEFGEGIRQRAWSSRLDPVASLTVPWLGSGDRQEIWRFAVSPLWRVQFDGLPESAVDIGADWRIEFHPRPDERLQLQIRQPQAVPGEWLAIDTAELAVQFGFRSTTASLAYQFRATRAGTQTITLPPGATVEGLEVANESLSQRADEAGRLTVSVPPGAHGAALRVTFPQSPALVTAMPQINLGVPVANLTQVMTLPEKRWVLWTHGPQWGPAVLYWAELAVFLLLAPLLARTGRTPLKTHHWLLLGLGFSTFAWGLLVFVGAWLFAIDWRERQVKLDRAWWFNARQVVLALLTVMVLLALLEGLPAALLGTPQMHVVGPGSSALRLSWFTDHAEGGFPSALVLSAPQWIYQLAILAWALWLSFALVGWLRWAWHAWARGGMWISSAHRRVVPRAPDPGPAAQDER